MIFYLVKPKDSQSPSRKWFVDEFGLEKVRDKYTNYSKRPCVITNRWSEFEATQTKHIWFDFGGMLRVGTPSVKEVIYGVEFEVIVTHIPTFIEALSSPNHSSGDFWQCSCRWHNYVFDKTVRDKLIHEFTSKQKLYDEMIEGYNKAMDNAIARSNNVISAKKYHKGE